MGIFLGDRARSGQHLPSAFCMGLSHYATIGTVQSVDFVTAPANWPLFYHTCWKSNSTINSDVFLGNVKILFTFEVKRNRLLERSDCLINLSNYPRDANLRNLCARFVSTLLKLAICQKHILHSTTTVNKIQMSWYIHDILNQIKITHDKQIIAALTNTSLQVVFLFLSLCWKICITWNLVRICRRINHGQ